MVTETARRPHRSGEYQFDNGEYMITRNDAEAKVAYANPTFIRISGYTFEELRSSPSNLLYHPDVPKELSEDLWKTLKSNGSWTGVIKHLRKSGEYFWAIATITPTIVMAAIRATQPSGQSRRPGRSKKQNPPTSESKAVREDVASVEGVSNAPASSALLNVYSQPLLPRLSIRLQVW